jgi:cell division septum initiation protein DivIVA
MNDDFEDPGLAMFDERATVVGGFPNAVLGYDKKEVDDHVRKLERQILELRRRVREQSTEHELLKAQANASDLTRLSGHASVLLTAAESQSDELRTRAEIEAEAIRQAASRDAEELRAAGQQEADDMRSTAMANLRRLRDKQTDELNQTLAAARAEADQVVTSARRHADAITREAEQQAAAIVAAAQVEAVRITSEAQAVADEARSTAARTTSEAHRQAAELLADATGQHQTATKMLEDETAAAVEIRSAAGLEAENIRIQAVREAEQHLAATRAAGAQLRARLDAEAGRRKEHLVAEIDALAQQKKAIQTQLGQIAGIGRQASEDQDGTAGDWPEPLYPSTDDPPPDAVEGATPAVEEAAGPPSEEVATPLPEQAAVTEKQPPARGRVARRRGRSSSPSLHQRETRSEDEIRDRQAGSRDDAHNSAFGEREGR